MIKVYGKIQQNGTIDMENIQNNESGLSARGKINLLIDWFNNAANYIGGLISNAISVHNSDVSAHGDIRTLIVEGDLDVLQSSLDALSDHDSSESAHPILQQKIENVSINSKSYTDQKVAEIIDLSVHDYGSFPTPEELRSAHPTANPGDMAIVASTDTAWNWSTTIGDWFDTDKKGEVTDAQFQAHVKDSSKHLQPDERDKWNGKADNISNFVQALTRENIISGDSVPTIWGKISKWFSDFSNFSGIVDLTDKPYPTTAQLPKGAIGVERKLGAWFYQNDAGQIIMNGTLNVVGLGQSIPSDTPDGFFLLYQDNNDGNYTNGEMYRIKNGLSQLYKTLYTDTGLYNNRAFIVKYYKVPDVIYVFDLLYPSGNSSLGIEQFALYAPKSYEIGISASGWNNKQVTIFLPQKYNASKGLGISIDIPNVCTESNFDALTAARIWIAGIGNDGYTILLQCKETPIQDVYIKLVY